ncbi:antibiotic biosynthesis monooxygenase [Streptomyces sp. NPDC005761]|uniref:antibiotic biosynthesis monooxygenase n=1 Tax=unclassified Streptomyces TaxID=2593676 RepID=UPI0033E0A2D4
MGAEPRAAARRGPDIARRDVSSVHITHWYAPGRSAGLALLDGVSGQWAGAAWPEGLLSFHAYLSTEGDTVLAYVQATRPTAHRDLTRTLRGPAAAGAVSYRLHTSVVLDRSAAPPGAVVIATFDVDGPERQDRIVESVAKAVTEAPPAQREGMLSAHFHAATDGSRVLNYAEWTSDEAHLAFLDGAARRATLRATGATPGVRPIGFRRFHLHHGITPDRSGT